MSPLTDLLEDPFLEVNAVRIHFHKWQSDRESPFNNKFELLILQGLPVNSGQRRLTMVEVRIADESDAMITMSMKKMRLCSRHSLDSPYLLHLLKKP